MTETKPGVRTLDAAFHKLLNEDSRPIPASYRKDSPIEPGPTRVPVERYISPAFFDLEVEKIWKRAWQMACHEDDIPGVGDYIPYDIAGLSFLIVRTSETQIKAYWNACLHRGRKLREAPGKAAKELRCPFHGWTWNTDGTLRQVPCQWDYPGLKPENEGLKEVKVGLWGRFIFINPDPDCESLESFLGDLPINFQLLPYEKRFKQVHVAKIIRCNWKVASEAFMESYHVIATHPQILLGGVHDVDTKYDVFGNYSRAIRCGALESQGTPEWDALPNDGKLRVRHPLTGWVYESTDAGLVQVSTPKGETGLYTVRGDCVEGTLGDVNPHLCDWVGGRQLDVSSFERAMSDRTLKSGGLKTGDKSDSKKATHPRFAFAQTQREALKEVIPSIADQISDIEFASVFFTLFPNFHPWGSFNRLVYRFRPNGRKVDECIMEAIYLAPIPENGAPYTPCSTIHWLGADDDWTDAPELGMLAKVFNQDVRNLPYVQEGLHTMPRDYVQFSDYNETKPRHMHMLIDEWISRP